MSRVRKCASVCARAHMLLLKFVFNRCTVCVNHHLCKTCYMAGACAKNHKAVHSLTYVVAGQDLLKKEKIRKGNNNERE